MVFKGCLPHEMTLRPNWALKNALLGQAMEGLHEHQSLIVIDVRRPSRIHFATRRVEKGQESPFSKSS
jgi:hypothetical protein